MKLSLNSKSSFPRNISTDTFTMKRFRQFQVVPKPDASKVNVVRSDRSRYFLKANVLDFPRPWVWKAVLSTVLVCLLFGQFWRLNQGAHLATLALVFVAFAGVAAAVWALWHRHGRKAKLRGAQEAHSQFLAAAEASLDAFSLLEAMRNDAGRIVDFRLLYVNANTERLIDRPRTELIGQ